MSRPRPMALDLWIDVICPWCLIGLTRLERAAGLLGLAADIRLRAFRLHRDWPVDGMSWRDFQAVRNLPDVVFDYVSAVARDDGIRFDFNRIARVPETTPLHRLLIAAREQGSSLLAYRAMVEAYFFEGADLAYPGTLAAVGARAGIGPWAVEAALVRQDTHDALLADEDEARRLGVRGVPFLRISGTAVAGAQSLAAYTDMLQRNLLPAG